MAERNPFSFASIVISYLMTAGGISGALLGLMYLHLGGEAAQPAFFAAFGVGALVGAFFAARASRGSTIIEPAIAALLVVATVCGLIVTTPIGAVLWNIARDEAARVAGIAGGAAFVGALVGAWLSEKVFGAATRSSIPWILYVALAAIGGCFLAFFVATALGARQARTVGEAVSDGQTATLLGGVGVGCLLAGLAAGASARTRVLAASFLGAAIGVFGFFLLARFLLGGQPKSDELVGAGVIAAGGAIVALAGAALGWSLVGRRNAG
jgi:hypothetical protein